MVAANLVSGQSDIDAASRLAKQHGCYYVMFDRDSDEHPELEHYDE